jgi:hypothetical protein
LNRLPENRVQRVIDPRLMMVIIISGMMFLLLVSLSIFAKSPHSILENLMGLPSIALFFVAVITPWYFYNRGYQVGWDDEGVYFRMPGLRVEAYFSQEGDGDNIARDHIARDYGRRSGLLGWFTWPGVSFMRYEDMVAIDGQPDKRHGGDAPFRVRSALYISGKAEPAGIYNDLIGLDYSSFKRESFLDFMQVLYSKRPELVPKGWAKQIAKRAANDK